MKFDALDYVQRAQAHNVGLHVMVEGDKRSLVMNIEGVTFDGRYDLPTLSADEARQVVELLVRAGHFTKVAQGN